MTSPAFESLLDQARAAHRDIPAIRDFCAMGTDLTPGTYARHQTKPAQLLAAEPAFQSDLHPFARAFIAAGPDAQWRETYKNTDIGDTFMDQFGCYCLIGPGAPWVSQQMAGFVVYMPAGLYYPWHHHPAEELYYVLAGHANFMREGEETEVLSAGDASFHRSNQPHAMETTDSPVLAYVTWRSELGTPPVLTERLNA